MGVRRVETHQDFLGPSVPRESGLCVWQNTECSGKKQTVPVGSAAQKGRSDKATERKEENDGPRVLCQKCAFVPPHPVRSRVGPVLITMTQRQCLSLAAHSTQRPTEGLASLCTWNCDEKKEWIKILNMTILMSTIIRQYPVVNHQVMGVGPLQFKWHLEKLKGSRRVNPLKIYNFYYFSAKSGKDNKVKGCMAGMLHKRVRI